MKQFRLLLLLALLMTAATGAWAQDSYKVSMKAGVKDATNWTITPAEATTTGVTEGTEVTLKYNGRLKVKGVTATSDAAAPSDPDGALNGKFSVSATKKVYFSKGNLRYASGAWSFFENQYDYYATYSADAWDKFGWSNSTNNFGMSTSTENADYRGDLADWGTVPGIGTGWFTLSNDEWGYLFNTRSASMVNSVADARYAKGKVNGVYGIILFPDTYTHPDGVTDPVGINEVGDAGWNGNNYNATDWGKMEAAGCVFLPATGYRQGTSVSGSGSSCSYRSSTRANDVSVKYVYFTSSSLNLNTTNYGYYGQCVRLVKATSDAAPAVKPAATVTTVPTATAAIIEANSTSALVNAGAANGGTMMYAVTTTNAQPASTADFSATIPTAQGRTAGTYYVWYYAKADDTHTDSDISTTAVAVDVWTSADNLAATMTTAYVAVKVKYNYNGENYCLFSSNGDGTYTFQSGYGYVGADAGDAKALVVEGGKLVFKQNFFSTFDNNWSTWGFSVTFDTSNNTYSNWVGGSNYYNPSLISVEVNGVPIALTQKISVADLVKEDGDFWSDIIDKNSDKIKEDGGYVVRISDNAKLQVNMGGDDWQDVSTFGDYQSWQTYKFEGD